MDELLNREVGAASMLEGKSVSTFTSFSLGDSSDGDKEDAESHAARS